MRQSTKYVLFMISLMLFILPFRSFYQMTLKSETKSRKEVYSYTNQFSYDYDIHLLNNKFMDQEDLIPNSNFYVTDLIDTIDLDFIYGYQDSPSLEVNTSYRILGKLQGVYTGDQEEQKIWQKEYILKEEQNLSNSTNDLQINEHLNLNLDDLNKLVHDFENELNIAIDAKYIVTLEIVNKVMVEGTEETIRYSPQVSIDLGKKTTSIQGDNTEETEYITREYTHSSEIHPLVVIVDIFMLVLAIILIRRVLKSETKVNIRNEYRQELNKILKLCADKIVQVSKEPDFDGNHIVEVKDFGEIIKVSEELFKPILYWDNKEKEESCFMVISNQIQYRYILKK